MAPLESVWVLNCQEKKLLTVGYYNIIYLVSGLEPCENGELGDLKNDMNYRGHHMINSVRTARERKQKVHD